MEIGLKQSLKLDQRLVMTPQLQQAIRLLQLSRLELTEAINQEMLENPVLEELSEMEFEPEIETRHTDEGEGEKPKEAEDSYDTLDWDKFLDDYEDLQYSGDHSGGPSRDEMPSIESTTSQPITLTDHLIWQLKLSNFTLEEEKIGRLIIGNLNDDGYLNTDLEMISQEAGATREQVEGALAKVQTFDPAGVGARDLKECLLLQARQFGGSDPIVEKIITDHLHQLETKDYRVIARALKAPMPRVRDAVKLIQSLEPRPGRPFFTDRVDYITPDIFVYKVGDDFVIVLNDDGLPKLRVSPYYRRLLKEKGTGTELTREYIQDKLRSAVWLIRSLHQRQRTIYRVMESILKHQREYFERGITMMKPMVLRDVAADIQMHESTVSRVTTNKYVYTPQGILPMKFFFNSKISTIAGGEVAAETVKDRIRHILEAEDQLNPLSDQEIVARVREYGINIARRTVTKYREMMGILSSTKRRRAV